MTSSGSYRKIGIAALIMMASVFLSRLMGLLREMTIAAVGGANAAVDAYRVAFVLPEILNHLLASGFLSITFIPIFSCYLAKNDEPGGWRIFSIISTVFGLLLGALVVLSMVLAPQFVPLLAAGRSDPKFLAQAVHLTRIILPAQLFFFGGGMLMAVQFAKERFAVPALAPLVYNLGIIMGGLLLGPRLGMAGFAWGALVGAFLGNFLIQVPGAWRTGMRFRPHWELRHPDLRRYVLLTLPLMLGLTMTFSTEIFSKFFGSYLPAGAIAHMDYALRIMMLLVAFFGQAVGVASYPYLARLAAEGRLADMNRLFNATLRYLALVMPVALLALVLRHEIVRVLFERGNFTPTDTRMTALAMAGLLLGAVAFIAQTVVNRGFYAVQNTLLPAVYSTIAVILSLPVYWIGINSAGLLGLGLAISLSGLIQVVVLFSVWNRKSENAAGAAVYRFYLKIALVCLPLGGCLGLTHQLLVRRIDTASLAGSMAVIILVSLTFAVLGGMAAWLLKIEEARVLWRRLSLVRR